MGVWIETVLIRNTGRGKAVTPFVGVWIETAHSLHGCSDSHVTPFVGVWIETLIEALKRSESESHPSWVCGLKPDVPLRERSG